MDAQSLLWRCTTLWRKKVCSVDTEVNVMHINVAYRCSTGESVLSCYSDFWWSAGLLQAATSPPSVSTLRSEQWTLMESGLSCKSGTQRARRDSEPSHQRNHPQAKTCFMFRNFPHFHFSLAVYHSIFFIFLCSGTTETPTGSLLFMTWQIQSRL